MSLEDKLDEIRRGAADRIPEDKRDVMHRATEDLRQSGILDNVLSSGDSLPAFSLPDTAGQTVSSRDLLAQGPLAVTFYRGVW